MAKKRLVSKNKIFVLDTNVLLHDPYSLFKFAEHDVYVPFVTLEELDNKKSGNQDVNRNARQATRNLDAVVSQPGFDLESGFALAAIGGAQAQGRLHLQRENLPFMSNEHLRKNDNLYLSVLEHLTKSKRWPHVVMVTKDLNLRIKARATGFQAEDYKHDHAIQDADLLYRGISYKSAEWLMGFGDSLSCWKKDRFTFYELPAFPCFMNEFFVIEGAGMYEVVSISDTRIQLRSTPSEKAVTVMGIAPRNEQQQAALSLLLNPNIDFVSLLGPAGTGKTLLTLAAGLSQVAAGLFDEVIFTRATIALGEDIGFLPGSEQEKLAPWVGALFDSLEVIAGVASDEKKIVSKDDLLKQVSIRAMTFMRGRTFHKKFVVLDEAQNLTPKQIKALITRAGEGTKVVCLGNLAQIDSPYLSETSSGLAYGVERFKTWPHFGSIILEKGERSRLANEGNDRL